MSGVDLDLVATSYRTLSDPAAFEEMIDAWNRKLAMLQDEPDWSERGLSGDLFAHLTRLEQFARSADPPSDDPIRQVVEASEEAIMVQSPEGRIAAANDAGMRLFGASAGAFDRLAWLDPASRSELITIRRSAAENGNRQRAILRMVSLENGGRDEAHLVEARVLRVPTSDKGFVAIRALDLPWAAPVGEALAEAFALTDAEVDVLRLFYASRDLSAVADTRGVSLKTVRTQFKAILAKTEARSQANLLHLVSVLCARVAADGGGRELDWADPFGNERILPRRSGKRLAFSWVGAEHGRPVLWAHGPGFNGTPPLPLIERMKAAGVRLILVSRPGNGNTDRDPTLSVEEDQVSALVELADALELRNAPAVGTTTSVQALHLARDRVPDRIGAVVAISHCWQTTDDEVNRMPVVHRTLFRLARRAPVILRSVCSVSLRIIHRAGPDWYVQRAHGQFCDLNRMTIRDAEVQALLRTDCRMLLAQGVEGFLSDLMLAYADTRPAMLRARSPTLWLMGSEDKHLHPVETPRFADTMPQVVLRILPGCSELMLYQRPDLVADAIVDAMAMS